MTSLGDPYGVLGVPSGAPMAEVKRAYRLLVKRNHPDAGKEIGRASCRERV
jgi:curved DNA-binding protein CbpA